MTPEDVQRLFEVEDIIMLPNGSWVSVNAFAHLFSSASNTPTHAELVAIDGGVMGYIPFFDHCKAQGLLN